jgi:hypothetical protein
VLCLLVFASKPEGTLDDQRAFFVPFPRNKYLETNILTTLSIIDIWESTLRKKKEKQIAKSAKRRR